MTKSWRLTRQAERGLIEIALWTIEKFGSRQAELYEEELIERCQSIAEGRAMTQSCNVLVDGLTEADVRFARAGEHFVVFVDLEDQVAIPDFLHSRSNLRARIVALTSRF